MIYTMIIIICSKTIFNNNVGAEIRQASEMLGLMVRVGLRETGPVKCPGQKVFRQGSFDAQVRSSVQQYKECEVEFFWHTLEAPREFLFIGKR